MTDEEFITQAIIDRMDMVFQRSIPEPTEEEKAARQEKEKQFQRILDSLPEEDRALLKEMQSEEFRLSARDNEFFYREGIKDGFSLYRFVAGG